MSELFGIEITDEQWDYLMCEQNKGKELKVVDGEVVAVEHVPTAEELKEKRIFEIKSRLDDLTKDLVQMGCGAIFNDEEKRVLEFRTLHNELRTLLGKGPREYK